MLLTKEVDYKVNTRSLKYYRNLGYNCKLNDIIKIKVEDLQLNSIPEVEYQCDKCKRIFKLSFKSFTHSHNINEKTFCPKCANENIQQLKYEENQKYLAKDGYKICHSCNRKLPANTDYFYIKNDTKDKWHNKCKECLGRKFTDYLTNIPKKGYKFCKKCKRELPANSMYFPTDNHCVDGTRNICRECDKKYGKFLSKPPVKFKPWSDEEVRLLKSVYADYTGEELAEKFFTDRSIRAIECAAGVYSCKGKSEDTYRRSCVIRGQKTSFKLQGRVVSDETKRKISKIKKKYYETHDGCMKGKKLSEEHRFAISRRQKGKWSGDNNPRHINPYCGKDNPNWRGGATSLYQELRSDTKEWFIESAKFVSYHCVITGKDFDNVHHLYPFKNIVEDLFNNLDLNKNNSISKYTKDEECLIRNEIKRLHSFYGYGAPLNKNVHKLFHDTYGYTKTTYDDFLNFVKRIKNGKFTEWFDKNNLTININEDFVDYICQIQKEVA